MLRPTQRLVVFYKIESQKSQVEFFRGSPNQFFGRSCILVPDEGLFNSIIFEVYEHKYIKPQTLQSLLQSG